MLGYLGHFVQINIQKILHETLRSRLPFSRIPDPGTRHQMQKCSPAFRPASCKSCTEGFQVFKRRPALFKEVASRVDYFLEEPFQNVCSLL
jgi:hypothetical protein